MTSESDRRAPATTVRRRRRFQLWSRLSIQSKLLAMLLVASVLSALLIGWAGYRSGSHSLKEAAYERLAAERGAKTREINNYLNRLTTAALVNSANATAVNAAADFSAGFDQLEKKSISSTQSAELRRYYANAFLPALEANTGAASSIRSFLPTDPAERYLQAFYTAPYGKNKDVQKNFAAAAANNDAGDGSAWSAAHAKYHDYFRAVVTQNGYEDAMIVRPDGRVVYTMYKGVDLGTDLLTGPFASARLTAAFDKVLASKSANATALTDFEPYAPSRDLPTAWSMSPIGLRNGKLIGVLLLQLPVSRINDVMTDGGDWKSSGFGRTGETFLVGPDRTMRSISRELVEEPDRYEQNVVDAGTPRATARKALRTGTTILTQPVRGQAIDAAFDGETRTTVKDSYHGSDVLVSYGPLDNKLVDWVILAQIDESEALGPARSFLRDLAIVTLALILAVSLFSMAAAQIFVGPIRALVAGVRHVAGGDLDARVSLSREDEFGTLADSLNEMATTLRSSQEQLEEEVAEHDRMLLSVMPASVAQRFASGEQNVSEDHQDVSVAFVAVDGLENAAQAEGPQESVILLNELMNGFDAAAEARGVERVRSLRSGYVATCGLIVPRVDHAQRMTDFARDAIGVVSRFNAQHDARVSVRIGVDSGSVTSGLIGSSAVYDLWGESVNVAFGVQSNARKPGVYVSARVYDLVRDRFEFESIEAADSTGDSTPVFRLVEEERA